MDAVIASYAAIEDGDLMLCPAHGVAYQRDMSVKVAYDESYFNKYRSYEDQAIANAINAGRIALVNKHAGENTLVLDVGIGSGEFVRKRPRTLGTDVNPVAIRWLQERGLWWGSSLMSFRAVTFWDVLEHVETPADYLDQIPPGGLIFTSLPIFEDLAQIRSSRHYRPGEHLYYWTEAGFIAWMAWHGFTPLSREFFETRAGRASILSFALRKVAPPR